jgi:hypothetical protein
MLARTLHGIASAENGDLVMVSLYTAKRGRFRIAVRGWPLDDKLQPLRLLNRGVYCGIPSSWKSRQSFTKNEIIAIDIPEKPFIPWTDSDQAAIYSESLSDNLLALVPEDSYLCAIPLAFGDLSVRSFVCCHAIQPADRPAYYKIGIVIDKELIAAFTMAPGTPDQIEYHFGKIHRYFTRNYPDITFPDYIYDLQEKNSFSNAHFAAHRLDVAIAGRELRTETELKALGCALARQTSGVPVFSGPAKSGVSRGARSILWIATAALLLGTALFAFAPVIINLFIKSETHNFDMRYRSIVSENPRLRAMISRNESLSASIIQLNSKFSLSHRTQWGRFLQALGSQRPEGLFLEKLGSETVSSSPNAIRIALSGFAQKETLVTDLITRLQKTGLVTQIYLSSIEKNKTKSDICDFRIVCTLTIISQ